MFSAFDVHYTDDGAASAAAVLFADYRDSAPAATYSQTIHAVADYVPGQFYRRELPCLLTLIGQIEEALEEMIIDGYVMHGDGPGLGQHLYAHFNGSIPVIGVAKSKYANAPGIEVFRGRSRRPLYVTAAGMDERSAAERIVTMDGLHRIPTLLKAVDRLARDAARKRAGDSFGAMRRT